MARIFVPCKIQFLERVEIIWKQTFDQWRHRCSGNVRNGSLTRTNSYKWARGEWSLLTWKFAQLSSFIRVWTSRYHTSNIFQHLYDLAGQLDISNSILFAQKVNLQTGAIGCKYLERYISVFISVKVRDISNNIEWRMRLNKDLTPFSVVILIADWENWTIFNVMDLLTVYAHERKYVTSRMISSEDCF